MRSTFRLGEHHDTRRPYTDLIDGFIVEHGELLREGGRESVCCIAASVRR